MKEYFIVTPDAAVLTRLTDADGIAPAPFTLDGVEGFLFEERYLERYLAIVGRRLERERPTSYHGVYTLQLSPTETTEVPAVPTETQAARPARTRRTRQDQPENRVEFESGFDDRGIALDSLKQAVLSKIGRATTLPIVIHDGDGEQRAPLNNQKFHVWFCASSGSDLFEDTPRNLWGDFFDGYANESYCQPSGRGAVLYDTNDWPVAELIGNNLYILFDWYDHDEGETRLCIIERVFDAAVPLIPLTKRERLARTKRTDLVSVLYQYDEPIHHASLRRKVAELLSPVINRPVVLHFENDEAEAALNDGRFHIWVDAIPERTSVMPSPARIFNLEVCRQNEEVFVAPCIGTPIVDSAGFIAAELVGDDNLYVMYDLTCPTGTCPGPARHLGKILEATIAVLRMDAAERQAIQRRYNAENVRWLNADVIDGHYRRSFGLAIRDRIQPLAEGGVTVHAQFGSVADPIDDESFHVWLYSSAGGPQTAIPLSRVWGIQCPRSRGFLPSGRGTVIYDDKGWQVAELIGRNLFIHYDLTVSNYDYFACCDQIFGRILEEVKFWLTASAEEQERRRTPVVINSYNDRFDYVDELMAATQEVLLPAVGKTIILHVGGGATERPMESINDGHFHLWLMAAPNGGRPTSRLPASLFDVAVPREASYAPSGMGDVILDPNNYPIAEYLENNLYVLGHCFLRVFARDGVFKKILQTSAAFLAMPKEQREEVNKRYQEYINEQSRGQYVQACMRRAEVHRVKLRQELEHYRQKIAEFTATLVDLFRRSREHERLLTSVQPSTDAERTQYAEEYTKLLQVRGVKRVVVSEETIQVYTDVITCVDPRTNRRHHIGEFRLTIHLDGQRNGLRFENLTHRMGNYDAPHVQDGVACLGNMQEQIPELLATFEFSVLTMVALEFLESVNVADAWGSQITRWPVVQA